MVANCMHKKHANMRAFIYCVAGQSSACKWKCSVEEKTGADASAGRMEGTLTPEGSVMIVPKRWKWVQPHGLDRARPLLIGPCSRSAEGAVVQVRPI